MGRCIFIILHNPHNNISKNNLTLYHKIQTPHMIIKKKKKNSRENGELVVISNSKTLTQLSTVFFSESSEVSVFSLPNLFFFFWETIVFLIWCWTKSMFTELPFVLDCSDWFCKVATNDASKGDCHVGAKRELIIWMLVLWAG